MTSTPPPSPGAGEPAGSHHVLDRIVGIFLRSNLSVILILLAVLLGAGALFVTPREEDPQIVVPLADVFVDFPGHSAPEVEQLVTTPLEKLLYQIDGVEYVYSMSHEGQAVITVRYYVGQDRERSLVKLYKKIDEHLDVVPPGVTGWIIKPVEIDDVPIVTLTLCGKRANPGPGGGTTEMPDSGPPPDELTLRRVAEEVVERLAAVPNVSRAYVVGGQPRTAHVYLHPTRLAGYSLSPLEVRQAISVTDVAKTAGEFQRDDQVFRVEAGAALASPAELGDLVVGVFNDRPVFLKDVARIEDGAAEATSYVRHGWGPGRGFQAPHGFPGTLVGPTESAAAVSPPLPLREGPGEGRDAGSGQTLGSSPTRNVALAAPAVTIALAKKKGTNAVWVAEDVLQAAARLDRDVIPDDMELVITRNYGLTADHKVNELVEALAVAVFIVIALLTLGLGWREALIVAVAVPVVFGLTLAVNYAMGYTINRVTLFALILALGLLVDDPIVDVENIARHFSLRRRATRQIVIEAISEIRPPLITATLAVIVSFLPMFGITGMMGPYMRPMALNVPVTMVMSMLVAFTITPWLSYHALRKHYRGDEGIRESGEKGGAVRTRSASECDRGEAEHDLEELRAGRLYRLFYPLMAPLLHSRLAAWAFLGVMGLLMLGAAMLAAVRAVPLKMLPFDNKNELLLVLDLPEGTTLERTDAAVRDFEHYLAAVPEVTEFTSYVGTAGPMDFNGLVRHYYLRRGDNVAEVRLSLVGKKNRAQQSHAIGLRLRDDLTAIAQHHDCRLKIVEVPPGPPVIATITAEVRGRPDQSYEDLVAAARTVGERLRLEPGVVDVDDTIEAPAPKLVFMTDREKAALAGVSTADIAQTLQLALAGSTAGLIHQEGERNPLRIELRLPRDARSSAGDLAQVRVKGREGAMVALAEIGSWHDRRVDQTIYHKNLERLVYVFAETAGRTPAECVLDIEADRSETRPIPPLPPGTTRPTTPLPLREGSGEGKDVPTSKTLQIADQDAGSSEPGSGLVVQGPAPRWRTFLSCGGGRPWWVPDGIRVDFAGEGEWNITLDVFRDLGIAFAAAMVGIYVLLVAQMRSFIVPIIVMLAIPLTVIGIMPGFWLLGRFAASVGPYADPVLFTATGMIGMIALSGIVTRDSIILVDFIHLSLKRGRSLFDAIMESRVVRLRPILLTTGAAMLGAAPIAIDPIFSGLAWALIFGLFASTVFTLFVIPVVYWLLYANRPGHGLPLEGD